MKIFQYSPLSSELKKKTNVATKKYKRLDRIKINFKKTNMKELKMKSQQPTVRKCNRSNLVYDSCGYHNIKF